MVSILIPTCKPLSALDDMIREITATTPPSYRVYVSCLEGESASVNRNVCLHQIATGTIAIMLDDDIRKFYNGWADDLLEPFDDPDVMVVSARLIREDGKPSQTCSRCYDMTPAEIEVKPARHCVLPTAAIAFRHMGHTFDEGFRGSGFEDGDWCFQYLADNPRAKFIQSNRCRLVHRNEMKNQRDHWKHNQHHFETKWPAIPTS